jgi:hypothetical protein
VPEAGLEPAHLAAGDFESLPCLNRGVALRLFFVAFISLTLTGAGWRLRQVI